MNIKKIIREEIDEWDWVRDTTSPITIGQPKEPIKNPVNTIVLFVNWMSGDADNFNLEKYSYNMSDDDEYNRLLLFLRAIKWESSYANHSGSQDRIGYISDWGSFRQQMLRKFTEDEVNYLRELWAYDVYSDGDSPASLAYSRGWGRHVEATYFDQSGIERYAEINWDLINI